MSARALKIALAASVALNLFAIAAGVTTVVAQAREEQRIEAQQRVPRDRAPFHAVMTRLDPEVRQRVKSTLKASALAARPDFDEARAKRREAVALAASDGFDAARITTLLNESRAAELRGRSRLEADAVQLLGTLEPADRAAVSDILNRRGRNGARDPRPAQPQAERAN
ncbi:hypothetical protein GCM10009422_11550 [Brevundimonas kwangchunensis]|uniref:Periplasmic heavy metal sensor n=1 Tax=Brevundimonas kwangchunensis TaxID=322163 RepID=A0ABP3RYZ2_9CAUL